MVDERERREEREKAKKKTEIECDKKGKHEKSDCERDLWIFHLNVTSQAAFKIQICILYDGMKENEC